MGLRKGDLIDLISNTISIDEFNSKFDNSQAFVVAFEVDDKEPGTDLDNFIQKGYYNFLDCELSPAPNENGKYYLFVEFLRNLRAAENIDAMLDSLFGVSGIEKWKMKIYGYKSVDYDNEKLQRYINQSKLQNVKQSTSEKLQEFFSLSDNKVSMDKEKYMQFGNCYLSFPYKKVGKGSMVREYFNEDTPLCLSESAYNLSNTLQQYLGSQYDVTVTKDHIIVHNTQLDSNLILIR